MKEPPFRWPRLSPERHIRAAPDEGLTGTLATTAENSLQISVKFQGVSPEQLPGSLLLHLERD